MKTIGLLGGTGWSSTINYYKILNQLVGERLGGYHSAKIILKSIDYHEIMSNYGKDHTKIAELLKKELSELIALKPDCMMICCNSLHKYYDIIKNDLDVKIPLMHAIDLVAQYSNESGYKKALLLATKFTMEDGFFADKIAKTGINVVIPETKERNEMQKIHTELMQNIVTEKSKNYFRDLIKAYDNLDVVILGCTEYPMVVDKSNSALPIIDPVKIQAKYAVDFVTK